MTGLDLIGTPPQSRYVYSENSEQIEDQEFPRDAVLQWHSIIGSDGYKYYRMGLPIEEVDYDRSLPQFIEMMTRTLCINMPKDELVDKWMSKVEKFAENTIKEQLKEELCKRCSIDEPELYR